MLGWFQALMPRETRFFDLFEKHAATLRDGAGALQNLLRGGPEVPEHGAAVASHENAADEVTREVMLLVRRTFITPFDRADIIDLISSMDDAIDQMHKTAKVTNLFEQRTFQPDMPRRTESTRFSPRARPQATPAARQSPQPIGLMTGATMGGVNSQF